RSGPDRHPILPCFRHFFDDPVEWKNDVSAIADGKLLSDVDTGFMKRLHLIEQRPGIDHYSIADHGLDARPKDSTWNQLQNEFFFANKDGVARIVAALITRHDGESLGEKVNHFTFSFIPPLRPQYNGISHVRDQNASLYLAQSPI